MTTVFAIGHSTRPIADLIAMLRDAGATMLADVRAVPMSRFNPQFNRKALATSLEAAGIGYRHMAELGGRRESVGPSPNDGLAGAFRAYADYALSPEFAAAFAELRAMAEDQPTAMMCAEKDWRNCHRKLIADRFLAAGFAVRHLVAPGTSEDAALAPGAEARADGTVIYPARTAPRLPGL